MPALSSINTPQHPNSSSQNNSPLNRSDAMSFKLAAMKKIKLDEIPWRERKSPKGKYHRFLCDVASAFKNPKTGPAFPSEPPFEVELVRLPPGATNFPLHSHATEWEF